MAKRITKKATARNAKRKSIHETVAKMNHVFFTADSRQDFLSANREKGMPTGKLTFMREMPMPFFEMKCAQDETYSEIPNDAELMARIIREIPGFSRS
jgi:hypothetical protein